MTPSDLDAIRAREREATAGKWTARKVDLNAPWFVEAGYTEDDDGRLVAEVFGNFEHEREADATFLASARTDIPALLAEVDRLRAALEAARLPHSEQDRPCLFSDGRFVMGKCICGADDHNAAIDRALRGEP